MQRASIIEACRAAAVRATDWLEGQLGEDGGFGEDALDLAAYHKAPSLMRLAGRARAAWRLLDFMAARFRQPGGDFWTSPTLKTADPVLAQYPGYLDGWVALGAHRTGRFDLGHGAWELLRRYQHPRLGACAMAGPWDERTRGQCEVLMTAHLGLLALHLGALDAARTAGEGLARFLSAQPDPDRLFLRMDGGGALVPEFPPEAAVLHVVRAREPGQAWFFVGYPMAFLGYLFIATREERFLATARGYADFAVRCGEPVTREHFGHKVGWGAALLARLTGDQRYRMLAEGVAAHLVESQASDGGWLAGQSRVARLDQSAEVAQWLLELSVLL